LAYYRATSEPRVPICGWISRVNGEILTDDQTYNRDGALNYRYLRPQGTAPTTPWSKEWFFYGYNDRLVKMQTSATLEPAAPTCMVAPPISLSRAAKTEWQYSYSPSGEREIKRLVRSPKTDSTCGSVYPWTYYLLGTNDEQQVVYHGRQISRADCDAGGIGRRVFFYPVEYRSYGADGVNIVWERDANGAMVVRFVGSDIQGSERYAVGKNAYQKVRDYLPFGVDVAVANDQRRGYLGKESGYETAPKYGVVHAGLYHERLMDMSARKYSKTQGAFTSVDELWRGQMDYSPYAYSFHDPINFMDPSGKAGGGNGSNSDGTTDGSLPGRKGVYIWTGSGVSPFQMINGFTEDEARSIRNRLDLEASGTRRKDFMAQFGPLDRPAPFDKYKHPFFKVNQANSTRVAEHPGTWDPMELVHLGLDLVGFIPGVVGVIADAVNGLLYLVEGEFKMGGLTLLAVIPGLDGLKSLKYAAKGEAHLATNGLKLSKQLASEVQMLEPGRIIIEAVDLRDATRLASTYGGDANHWVKMGSSSFKAKGGVRFETHWYENLSTGQRVEFKTKF